MREPREGRETTTQKSGRERDVKDVSKERKEEGKDAEGNRERENRKKATHAMCSHLSRHTSKNRRSFLSILSPLFSPLFICFSSIFPSFPRPLGSAPLLMKLKRMRERETTSLRNFEANGVSCVLFLLSLRHPRITFFSCKN